MQVSEGTKFDLDHLILEKALHAWHQISLGVGWPQNFCELVDGCRESLFDPEVIDFGQLVVQGLEARPLVGSEHKNESWEVE